MALTATIYNFDVDLEARREVRPKSMSRAALPPGEIWRRGGLDERMRQVLVLGTLIALGRWERFRLHVSAAVPRAASRGRDQEIVMQQAVYCGVPAAAHASEVAKVAMQ